jgi:hypothetical protein
MELEKNLSEAAESPIGVIQDWSDEDSNKAGGNGNERRVIRRDLHRNN